MLISADKILLSSAIKSGLWPEENIVGPLLCQVLILSDDTILPWLNHMNAAKHVQHMHTVYTTGLAPLFLLLCRRCSLTPDPWLCLSFLRRCHIPQQPHPPHRAGPVPAADHHRTASLVLPQVNSPALQGLAHLTSTPPWASLTGRQPGSGAELRVTNTSSFSH